MSLNVYNTPTRRVEPFQPLSATAMHACGMTTYDQWHGQRAI
jgi:cysteinyl-tRNA synthetase